MNRRDVLTVGCGVIALGWASVAQATGPIPGIDIIVQKKPGDKTVSVPTGKDGVAVFEGLLAGEYDVIVKPDRAPAFRTTVTVGTQKPLVMLSKAGSTVTPIILKEPASVRVLVEAL